MKKLTSIFFSVVILLFLSISVYAEGLETDTTYRAHVSDIGWQTPVHNGETAGTTGQAKDVEAIEITDPNLNDGSQIEYQAHVENVGWQGYVTNGQTAGTTGKGLQIEALQIKLTGPAAGTHDVFYRVHVANVGWLDWAQNDQVAGTTGFNLAVEALEIRFQPKGQPAPGNTERYNILPESLRSTANVHYISLPAGQNWQDTRMNGNDSGTVGQDIALDGLIISLPDIQSGGVSYRVSTKSEGWNAWANDAAAVGRPGHDDTIEAVQIKLYGLASYLYDIYYQAHSSDVGWEGWAKDGQTAGSLMGLGKLQAIRIYILPKTIVPPYYDPNASTFVKYEIDRPANTYGRNYAYVSIPRQTLIYFNADNEPVFQTPIITGQVGNSNSITPTGNYIMRRKAKHVTLRGSTYTQLVDYWIPFIGEMYGVHDADRWRTPEEFGGNTYLHNGSHGCVNVPLQAMGTFYSIMTPGDPIIIR